MPSKPVVHVVDDDAAIRRSLERLLASAGFTPVTYESPLVFLAAASGRLTGCILLDLWMPGMDGLEVQARLRQMGSADYCCDGRGRRSDRGAGDEGRCN